MAKTQYTYVVARIRALEASLLSDAVIEQLLACKDVMACLRLLQEKGWGDSQTPQDAETLLMQEQEKLWATIRTMDIDMSVLDVLSYPNQFHNLKAAIKAVYTGQENERLFYENTPIPPKVLLKKIREKDYASLPKPMQSVAEEAMEVLLHSGDGQLCDVMIDRACLEAILEAGRTSKMAVLRDYAEASVAAANIKIAVRCVKTGKSKTFMKRAMAACDSLNIDKLSEAALTGEDALCTYLAENGYADGAEALKASLLAFERWCDNRLIETMKPQKMEVFSVGPVVAYVIARENEIKTVRIILTCKQNGLPEDSIRERIREMYV